MRSFLNENDMLAYLAMMAAAPRRTAPRAQTDRQHLPALRPDGQPLPQAADGRDVWAAELRNEIVWKRTTAKSDYRKVRNWPRSRCHPLLPERTGSLGVHAAVRRTRRNTSNPGMDTWTRMADPTGSTSSPGMRTRGQPTYEFMGVTRSGATARRTWNASFLRGGSYSPAQAQGHGISGTSMKCGA